MTNITIPPEAVEAAAIAAHDQWRHDCAVEADEPVENWREWDELDKWEQDSFCNQATAAIRAALAAWPGMSTRLADSVNVEPRVRQLILPLPQEKTDDEA